MAAPVILSATAAIAGAAYVNGKLGIQKDLTQLSYDREWFTRFQQRIKSLEGFCTLYRIFELADRNSESLWFEGRTWTYAELKSGTIE